MAATSFFGGEFFGGEFFNTPAAVIGGGGSAENGTAGGRWSEARKQKRKKVAWQGREYWSDDLELHLALLKSVREAERPPEEKPVGLSAEPPVAVAEIVREIVPEEPNTWEPAYPALPVFSAMIQRQLMIGDLILVAAMRRAADEYLMNLEREDEEALIALLMATY